MYNTFYTYHTYLHMHTMDAHLPHSCVLAIAIGSPHAVECVQQEDSNGVEPQLPEPSPACGDDSHCEAG